MDWLLSLLGGFGQAVTWAYVLKTVPGILLLVASTAGVVLVAWRHARADLTYRWTVRSIMDLWLACIITIAHVGGWVLLLTGWRG